MNSYHNHSNKGYCHREEHLIKEQRPEREDPQLDDELTLALDFLKDSVQMEESNSAIAEEPVVRIIKPPSLVGWPIHPRSKTGLSKDKREAIIDYFESVRLLVRESDVESLTHDIIFEAG